VNCATVMSLAPFRFAKAIEGFGAVRFLAAQPLSGVVNTYVYSGSMAQVQIRLPQEALKDIDRWVKEGRFKSRSDAIRMIVELYKERERTRAFYDMLVARSREAKTSPETLVPLEEFL